MSTEDFALIVSFPDQSETFVLGFEAGMIWQRMESGDDQIEVTIHSKNIEVITRMCAAANLKPVFSATEFGEWAALQIKRDHGRKPDLRLVKPKTGRRVEG